jgi:hypothetical protein
VEVSDEVIEMNTIFPRKGHRRGKIALEEVNK